MPCDESVLGFSNRWYASGIINAIFHQLTTEQQILIFSSPYLLARKRLKLLLAEGIIIFIAVQMLRILLHCWMDVPI